MYEEYNKHDVAVYGGYLDDEAKLLQSSSGGIATALSEYVLSQGGYVAGVAYSKDFYKAEYIIIDDASELCRLKGSKYIDFDKTGIYADVKRRVDSGKLVLFFGLPCVVAALYAFLGARPENLLTCELVCHGPTYAKVHSDYIAYLEKKHKSKVTGFSVRYKKDAWHPSYLYAEFENRKKYIKPFYETEYGYAFSVLAKKSCYACKFKGNNRQGDIMIGDFWGATSDDAYWNKCGVSSVFAETEKGNAFIKSIPGIKLFQTTFEKAVQKNRMVIMSRKPKDNRDAFEALLSEHGLIFAVDHSLSLKQKLKRVVMSAVPDSIRPTAKSLAARLKKRP